MKGIIVDVMLNGIGFYDYDDDIEFLFKFVVVVEIVELEKL